jgi:hypothetical protein
MAPPEACHGSAVEAACRPQARDEVTHSMMKTHKGERGDFRAGVNMACSLAFYPERFEASTKLFF